jgi:CAAX protease family protein
VYEAAERRKSWSKIWAFVILAAILTLSVTCLLVTHPAIPGPLKPTLIMWVPAVSAISVKLIFDRNVLGLGFGRSGGPWILVGVLLPLAYALPVYLPAWHFGVGGFNPARLRSAVPYISAPGLGLGGVLVLLLTLGLLDRLTRALGEEIGWRGFLVPGLLQHMPLWKAGVVSGVIWFAYHLPLIIYGSYSAHGGPPLDYQITCFAVMVISMGIFFAWLRQASGSVWPCALLHASHNLLIQAVFDQATVKVPRPRT